MERASELGFFANDGLALLYETHIAGGPATRGAAVPINTRAIARFRNRPDRALMCPGCAGPEPDPCPKSSGAGALQTRSSEGIMEHMASGSAPTVPAPSRASKVGATLAWASMALAVGGLVLIVRIYVAFGEVSGASWGSAWALLVGALPLAGVARRLRPSAVGRHDIASTALVVTFLCLGIAVLATFVLLYALTTDG